MADRVCLHCGGMNGRPFAIFCSKQCSNASYYNRKKSGDVGLLNVPCKNCGTEFQQTKITQFCCSKLCSSVLYRRHNMTPKQRRKYKLKANYDLTEQGWEDLFTSQNGLCAICMLPITTADAVTDHDHKTGEVRGILCRKCNLGIGCFDDNVERMLSATRYLASQPEFYG